MQWSVLPFSKHKGKTLPGILVRDIDWFFWMLPNLYGRIGEEAEDLAHKARAIKIPSSFGKNVEVEYRFEMGDWPAPGSEDTELGVFMEPEVSHGETEVYPRVQA
jgi:hypothetical protein